MIELVLSGVFAVMSTLNTFGTILLWFRYANQKNIISMVTTDEDGEIRVNYPFLSK